jgi:hypothetical protein
MMKKIICLLAFTLLVSCGFAEEIKPIVFRDIDTALTGLKDEEGNVLIEATYDTIGEFNDGIALVSLDMHMGAINAKGVEVIEPIYSVISPFVKGQAVAYKDDKAGIIDTAGRVIIPFEYSFLSSMSDGHVLAMKDGKYGLINKSGEAEGSFEWDDVHMADYYATYKHFVYEQEGLYGVANFKGDILYGPERRELLHLSDDRIAYKTEGLIGVIDLSGKELFSGDYVSLEMMDDIYIAQTGDGFAFLNEKGKKISDDYKSIKESHNHIVIVKNDNGYSAFNTKSEAFILSDLETIYFTGSIGNPYIYLGVETVDEESQRLFAGLATLEGEVVVEPGDYFLLFMSETYVYYHTNIYENRTYGFYNILSGQDSGPIYKDIQLCKDGSLIVVTKEGQYGLLDREGQVTFETALDYIYDDDRFYILLKGGKFALYDKKTKTLGDYTYDNFYKFQSIGEERVAIVSVEGKYGYLKEDETFLVDPYYDAIEPFKNGYSIVCKNDQYGFVDEKGLVISQPTYERMADFEQGLSIVRSNGKYGLIKENGDLLVSIAYDDISPFTEDGYSIVKKEGQFGLLNREGQLLIEPSYENLEFFTKDMIFFYDYELRKYGIVNASGRVVTEPLYDGHDFYRSQVISVKIGDKYALMNNKGQLLTDFEFDKISSFIDGSADIKIDGKEGIMNLQGDYIIK